MCLLCGSSLSSHTHTHKRARAQEQRFRCECLLTRKWMDILHVYQPTQVFEHKPRRTHTDADVITTRLYSRGWLMKNVRARYLWAPRWMEGLWWSGTLFLNKRAQWRRSANTGRIQESTWKTGHSHTQTIWLTQLTGIYPSICLHTHNHTHVYTRDLIIWK